MVLNEIATKRLRAALVWVTGEADGDPTATRGGAWNQNNWDECIGHRLGVEWAKEVDSATGYPWADSAKALEVTFTDDPTDEADAFEDAVESLFNAGNTVLQLWTIAAEVTDGAIVVPAELVESGS